MADDAGQLFEGDDRDGDERAVRFDNPLFREGWTPIPNVVLTDPDLSTNAKLVYIGLCYYAREAEKCFPGQERFAADLGMSDRGLRNGLRELENASLVRSKRRRGRSNLYWLTSGTGKSCRSVPANGADQDRQNMPESKKKQLEEEAEGSSKAGSPPQPPLPGAPAPPPEPDEDAQAREVWDHYVAVFKPQRAKLGPNRLRGIKRALQEVDVETLKRAIDGLKNFRAHKPGNTSLETIWKTYKGTGTMVERIEFFASQAKSSVPGGKAFPSAQPAIVAQRQLDVQRGHESENPDIVERAKQSEAWLKEHGIETVKREADGYPVFRAMNAGGAA